MFCSSFGFIPLSALPSSQSLTPGKTCSTGPLSRHRRAPVYRAGRWSIRMQSSEENDSSFRKLAQDIREYMKTCPDDEPSPLAYVTLRKAGRVDLVSRIMDAGGYINVSESLGIGVDESQFIPPRTTFASATNFVSGTDDDLQASLTLGRDLEARLDTIEDVLNDESFPARAGKGARRSPRIDRVPSGEQLRMQNEMIVPPIVDESVPDGERFTFTAGMRVGLLSLAALTAAGYGRASPGILDEHVIHTCRSLASGLGFAHLVLALYAFVVLAPRQRRSGPLWFAKVLLSGPLAIKELSTLDELN